MRKIYLGTTGIAVVLLCGSVQTVFAQAGSATAQTNATASANSGLQEVIVTARRRAERLETVPATITALNSAALIKQGIHTEADLQTAVSGLIIRTGNQPNQLNYVIRGETIDSYSGSVPGVQPYVDEVPYSSNAASTFYDMSNVQVLKGPQGTLFGRNTTGGAVLYQTEQPNDEFGGYASVQYGNYDHLISEAAVNLPIVPDKLLVRVAGTYTQGGGFEHNLYDGSTVGDQSTRSGRMSVLWHATDELTNQTTVQYTNISGQTLNTQLLYAIPCGQVGGANTCTYEPSNPGFQELLNDPRGTHIPNYPAGYVYPGGLANYRAFLNTLSDPYTGDWNAPNEFHAHSVFLANTSTYDLGSVTLKNIFGYDFAYSGVQYDDDGTPYPILQGGRFTNLPGCCGDSETNITTTYSDEFQVQGKSFGDKLNWITGFYFDHDRYEFSSPIFGAGIAGTSIFTFDARYHIITDKDTYAPFAQATYALTDQLNLTAGFRYTFAKIHDEQGNGSVFGQGNPLQVSESDPSWTVTLDYKLTPDLMTYVTTRGSWRVGGYTIASPPVGNTITAATGGSYFLPEEVKDVEVGAKFNSHVADMPVQLNVDAFNSWVTNVQKSVTLVINGITAANTINVPASEVTGFEGDARIMPTSWLRLGGNASYDYARFTNNAVTIFGAVGYFGPYGDTPRWSGSLYGEVSLPIGQDMGDLTFRTDAYAQSPFYFSQQANTVSPGTKLPQYVLVNMRLDWSEPMGVSGLTASLFVKNLNNKLYYTGGDAGGPSIGTQAANFGVPRTYGFVIRQAF